MKISHNWLQQFIKTDLQVEEISTLLTNLGLEVEGSHSFESIKGGLKGVVVGEILKCEQHPNADRLKKTEVDLGNDNIVSIVCGAPNVKKGQKVLVATVGTILNMDDGKTLKISKSKIRGELSMGMICAEDELGLGDNHDGILVLENIHKKGTLAAEIFNVELDTVFEIGLTPNRADAMSHMGVARDLKALCLLKKIPFQWSIPETSSFHVDNTQNTIKVTVKDTDKCHQYYGLTISDIIVAPSPVWLQNRLKAIGISPKNNVVDITNYVLHDLGQPLHAFDAGKINKEIIVKTCSNKTPFTTLDQTKRILHSDDLMICDSENPLCIAGIFGGLESGIDKNTTSIFLESAYFNPVSTRKSAKRHTLNTDASFRFERGIDPEIGIIALKRAAILIKQLAGGQISSEIQDFSEPLVEESQIFLNFETLKRTIGQSIDQKDLNTILNALEVRINNVSDSGIEMTVPRYRVDVKRPADIIEEILRVYGFNNLDEKPLQYESKPDYNWKSQHKLESAIADRLTGFGFIETINNSLGSTEHKADFNDPVTLKNPLSVDLSQMRQSLVHKSLEVIAFNINRQNKDLKLFEFGSIYGKKNETFIEAKRLNISLVGNVFSSNWNINDDPDPFFYFKGLISDLFETLGIKNIGFVVIEHPLFNEAFELIFNKKSLGFFGLVSNALKEGFGIKQEVYIADLNWDTITKSAFSKSVLFKQIDRFPAMRRDFALLIDQFIKFEHIKKSAMQIENKILKEVSLFDVYEGKNLPNGKKSYGISFMFQDKTKTLTDIQVDKVMGKLKKNFEKEFKAELR